MPSIERRSPLRRLRVALWGFAGVAVFLGGIAIALRWTGREPAPDVISGAPSDVSQQFSLIDRDGKPVTPATLAGQPYAIFFGFTRCPDVCPTTLSRMAHLRKAMGADGGKVRIVFVSVDTGHDKPADVGAYVDLFGTPILGLTGSARQIADAAKSFRVFFQKIPIAGGDYTIDHSAFVILMDRDGRFRSLLSDHDSEAAAIAELRQLIA